ncbi:MAG: tetratricopeptide repeat protein [Candidatus Melainabacteria bacterium]|nr:tetratricopeptide repeat protein [Candidatus Melainabacteria bacterium]
MKAISRFLVLSAVLLIASPANAAETLLTEGIEFYKAGQYSKAKQFFEYIIKKEPTCWQAHYELANTHMKMNELALAKQEYVATLNNNADGKVAKICGQLIAYIDHISGVKSYENATTTSAVPVRTPATATTRVEFKHRINVVPPLFNHQAVGQSTIDTVTRIVDTLPPNIYEILDAGGATVNIAPNITDKWPDMLKGKLDAEGLHLAQDAARCYGHDVYIYERKIIPDSTKLGDEVFDSGSVTNVLYHELGHAVDESSGTFTKTKDVLDIYQSDVDKMSDDVKSRLWYYTKPGYTGAREAFAECFAGLMGANGKDTDVVRANFPRYREWARNKFKL